MGRLRTTLDRAFPPEERIERDPPAVPVVKILLLVWSVLCLAAFVLAIATWGLGSDLGLILILTFLVFLLEARSGYHSPQRNAEYQSAGLVPTLLAIALLTPAAIALVFIPGQLVSAYRRGTVALNIFSNICNWVTFGMAGALLMTLARQQLSVEMTLLVFPPVAAMALILNFVGVAIMENPGNRWSKLRSMLPIILPELRGPFAVAVLFTIASAWAYNRDGLLAIIFIAAALLAFQLLFERLGHVEGSLRAERDRSQEYLDVAGVALLVTNRDLHIEIINQRGLDLLGANADRLEGELLSSFFVSSEDRDQFETNAARLLEVQEEGFFAEVAIKAHNDHQRQIIWHVVTTHGGQQRPSGFIISGEDVTERRAAEAQVRHLAYHDPLTGLANRTLFGERLGQEIQRANRHQRGLALFFIDIDGFKPLNDQLGHLAGDEALKIIAQRLVSACRDEDLIARPGGDEFLALLTEWPTDTQTAHDRAQEMTARLEKAVSVEMNLLGRSWSVGASIGIALYPCDANSADDLLSLADKAMYRVKRQRPSR